MWSFRTTGRSNHQPDPPQVHEWPGYGRTNQELAAGPSTGHDSPAALIETSARDGELAGPAQLPRDDAVGDSSGAVERIDGASEVRKEVLKANSVRGRMPARQRVATRRARKSAASAHTSVLGKRLKRLQDHKLPKEQQRLGHDRDEVATVRARHDSLPLIQRATLIIAPGLAAIGIVVFGYDGVVLAPALQHAGFGLHGSALWFAAVTTPLTLVAVCSVLGALAGAIALHVPTRERLRLAVAAIVVGGLALVGALALLTVFRAEATTGHNGLINALTHGVTQIKHVVTPWWFGPLQLAGSVAAIAAGAMYTMGKDGRELRKLIATGDQKVEALERAVAAVEAEIEQTHREIERATVAVHEIDVDAAAAEVEVQTAGEALRAELDAEDGLRKTAIGKLRTVFDYTHKIYANGGVWRVALPTDTKWFKRYTPPPGDAEIPPPRFTPPNGNGSGPMTPEELGQHTGLTN